MKISTILAPFVLLSLFWMTLLEANQRSIRERDFEAVQEYVNSKRTIPMEEKGKQFTLSADIRFIWAHVQEKADGKALRGSPGAARENETTGVVSDADNARGVPFSTNDFNVELNLYFDYLCDRNWAVAWLKFDNRAGCDRNFKGCSLDPEGFQGSGTCEHLCLKKAYMGYNICANGCSRLDIELGRRPLYNVYDSRVQFQSRFDGLLFRYAHTLGNCGGDFYNNTGFFIVDNRVDHYAWVTELGLLNIHNSGVDLKYSFIDWKSFLSHNRNRCNTKNPHGVDFRVSQWTAHYTFCNPRLSVPTKLYGAVLVNHAARKWEQSHFRKENLAWYAGFIIGQVCGEGDWALDINYQYVEAQAVPCQDVSGIGERVNLLKETFTANGRGFTNYKGIRAEFLYAITDNFAIDATLELLSQITKVIGGRHSYSMFELSAIYAF